MRTLAIAMLAGVSALAATTAARADEITTSGVQQVRLVRVRPGHGIQILAPRQRADFDIVALFARIVSRAPPVKPHRAVGAHPLWGLDIHADQVVIQENRQILA